MTRMEYERRLRGWSQMVVGFHAGLAQSDVSALEHRRITLSPERAERLARVLGVAACALMDEVEAEPINV